MPSITTTEGHMAHQHPPFPLAEQQERGVIYWNHLGSLIHVYQALQSDASASRLHALRQSAMRARSGKANAEALWEAFYSLSEKAKEAVETARQRGHLLLCWSGTRALEDALAGGAR